MTFLSSLRQRLARAIERGDPRLGLSVGVLVAFASAFAFSRPSDRLELLALDLAYQGRSPIRESDKILLVDMDDNSFRKLPFPIPRESYAQALMALDRLGARRTVFDIQFKTVAPKSDEFDPETGEYLLPVPERLLRFAIAKAGNVLLAYHFEFDDPLPPEVRKELPKLSELFTKNIGAEADEAARFTGLPKVLVASQLEAIRERAVMAAVAGILDADPAVTFAQLRARFLPEFKPRVHGAFLITLQYAYWHWRGVRLMESKLLPARVESKPPGSRRVQEVLPIYYPLLEAAQGVGCVNAVVDPDGVMRRPWAYFFFRDRLCGYLGMEAALRDLIGPGETIESVIHRDRVDLVIRGTPSGAPVRTVSLPLDREGRILVNFAGNARRNRRTADRDGESYFKHLPFIQLVQFYQERYQVLDANVRAALATIPAEDHSPAHREYLAASDRLNELLAGRGDAAVEEARGIEARLDHLRDRFMQDYRSDIAAIDAELPKLADKKRLQDRLQQQRTFLTNHLEGIAGVYRREAELRKVIEGKICFIGSASTASGDLYPTPLAPATPGVDVVANVTNMALTGQALRRAPQAAAVVYLALVGLLVSFAVTHFNATASAGITLAVSAAVAAVFWIFFTGPSLLVPGSGPVVTAVFSFAGVTAFKELVTQRSKRKLQRELEKNTSAELVKILMEHPEFLSIPRKMTGTFFFSDVKSFTSTSEKMAPEILVPYINRYLDRMTQSLKRHLAYLDKYIGDGIMALFGIPVPTADHAKNACLAALENQAQLKALNAELRGEGLPEIKARIGIHSGDVIAGYVGATDRSDYTVLGDNVNLASRLEGANKEYDSSILISGATWELVGGQFLARELDNIRVVGKRNAVRIYELLASAAAADPFPAGFLREYDGALAAFKERRWSDAIDGFERALALKPGDKPSEMHLGRAHALQMSPPPPDWEGVFELTSK